MANIGWFENRTVRQGADVVINRIKSGTTNAIQFRFKDSVYRSKLGRNDRVAVGYDAETCRIYFAPCGEGKGYKVASNDKYNSTYTMKVAISKLEDVVDPELLYGSYTMMFDDQERLFYIDITENVTFQSKKIRAI